MEAGNSLCSECGRGRVECFCTCSGTESLLCSSCFLKHVAKAPRKEHPMRLIETLPFFRIPGYYERLEARTSAWPLVHEQALLSLQTVDRATEEITAETEKAIAILRQRCADYTEELRQIKSRIQAAVEEVENTLNDDSPALKTELSQAIREALMKPGDGLKLFSYHIESKNGAITMGFFEEMPFSFFPCVLGNTVRLLDLNSKQISTFTVSPNFGWGGSFCLIDTNSLLCVGAESTSAATYNLDIPSRLLTPLAPMNVARKCAGIIKSNSSSPSVYVFGGWNHNTVLASCEKFGIATKTWTRLKDMGYARGGFSPCLFEDKIYLPDTCQQHHVIETFHVSTEAFAVFPVALPNSLSGYCTAFIRDGELTILTYSRQIGKLRLRTETQFRVLQSNKECRSSCPPMIVGNLVYIAARESGQLLTFSLSKDSFLD